MNNQSMKEPHFSIVYAHSMFARMRGLLGKKTLPDSHGMVILPCNAVHTIGMKFTIDIRFFNRQGCLLKTYHAIKPGRLWIWGGFSAYAVLETRSGDRSFDIIQHLSDLTPRG